MATKNPTARSTWNFSLWWAITGSNWFRSEHILKERSEAQNVVSRGCRRLYDCREKRKMAIKNPTARSTWNFSLWWAITGSNWFRSEHILKEQSDAQNVVSRGCRRLYDYREKRKKARKKTPWSRSHEVFFLVGENRIELVPQRTSFEGAKRRTNDRERGCRRLNDK